MVTTAGRRKRSVYTSVLLVLVIGLAAPAYAGTIRYDFDRLSPWRTLRDCGGISTPGPSSVNVDDGYVKVMDGGCGMGSRTGIHHLSEWADYEVKMRIKVVSLGNGVNLVIRATPEKGFGFRGNSYRIWRDSPVEIGKWHDVRIEAEGNKARFFIDGKKVSGFTSGIMFGGVALMIEMGEFWLDYVEIILPVQPQGRLITCWAKLKQS
ncbi:hypothetical protein ACFL6S_10045 [Candidatus Poribacteria bacterium]